MDCTRSSPDAPPGAGRRPAPAGEAGRLAALVEAHRAVEAAAPETDALLRTIVEQARALTGAAGAALSLVEGGELVCRATLGSSVPAVNHRSPLDAGGTVPPADAGAGSVATAPIEHRGRMLGVLRVGSPEPGAFDTAAADSLRLLALLLAPSLEPAVCPPVIDAPPEERDAALGESREPYRVMFDAAPVGIALVELDGRVVQLNAFLERQLGYTTAELLGRSIAEVTHPEDINVDREAFEELVAGRRSGYQVEKRYVQRDGRVVWGDVSIALLRDGDGHPRYAIGMVRDVTERIAAQRELLESNQVLEALIEASPLPIQAIDSRSRVTIWNPAAERAFGWRRAEVIGRPNPVVPAGSEEEHRALRDRVFAGEAFTGVEVVRQRRDGSPITIGLSTAPIRDADGRVQGAMAVLEDITQRKRQERALADSEALLRAVIDGIPDPVFLKDLEGRYRLVNRAGAAMAGCSIEELIGRSDAEVLPPEFAASFREMDQQVVRTGRPYTFREAVRTGSGELRRLLTTKSLQRNAAGEAVGILGFARDITEAERAKAELARSEAHYRRLVLTSPHPVYALDARGLFIELNPAGERLLERSVDEVLGRPFPEIMAPESMPEADRAFATVMRGTAETVDLEIEVVRPSGERRRIAVSVTAIHEDGLVVGLHGVARDVTEERERERRARLLATILEQLPEQGVAVISATDGLVYANRAHARILGYDPASPPAGYPGALLPDEAAQWQLAEVLRRVREGQSWTGQLSQRRLSDGEVLTLDAMVGRVEDQGQELFFALLSDASARLAREQHLRRAERLASVGTLLSGVAHELNNPLHAIRNFAELLLYAERPDEEREDLEMIRREADRAARIVSDLRAVARNSQAEAATREPVDLNEVARHVLRLRDYPLRTSNIAIVEALDPGLPPVWADRSQVEQVLLNLVVNAEHAMATRHAGGTLTVRTISDADGAALEVGDDGPGIPAEHLGRIFDPFWTTKAPGEGTGLGLSLVHSIVTEHGGEVRVESEPGAGARFSIYLPRAVVDLRDPSEQSAAAAPARQLRLLVVDDEPSLRRSLVRFLRRRGHLVEEAGDGARALELLDDAGDPGFDAVLSDLKMPGLGGQQLLAALRERGAGMERRLVFLTGDAAGGSAARLQSSSGVPVLLKPVELDQVALALEHRAEEARAAG